MGVLDELVSFVSCIVMMSALVSCMRCFSSSILFLIPFMFICNIIRFLLFCCVFCGFRAGVCVCVVCDCERVLCVWCVWFVGPGLDSTSPAFVSSNASHPAGLYGRLPKKNKKNLFTSVI